MALSTLLPLPSNNNTMDPEERTRLLRTARKIEALLGTTPQVVDSRARRRNDVYVSQFSSSASSLESTSSETEHSRKRPDVRDVFSGGSPSSTSPSPKVLVANYDRRTKKSKGGRQPLAQPLLLRMSAVPVDHRRRQSTSSIGNYSSGTLPPRPKLIPPSIPAPPLITPFERRKFKVDSVLGPLSPLNVSHFPGQASRSQSDLDLPLTPTASEMQDPATLSSLSDREKRIKMAKLQRMMGENIPPELVFRETTRKLSAEKKLRRRSRSLSSLRNETASSPTLEQPVEKDCKGKGKETDAVVRPVRPLPTLPLPAPLPRSLPPTPAAPMITQTTTTTTSSPLLRQLSLSMKQKGRKSRPKSLTLGTASAFVAANIRLAQQEKKVVEKAEKVRGTVSLDEGRHWLSTQKKEADNDEIPAVDCPEAPFRREKERIENIAILRTEIWRRKEREWSGEWNVQNMDEVAKALRGLRAN